MRMSEDEKWERRNKRNIWNNYHREFLHINATYQTTDPKSSENNKQDEN